MFDLIKIFLKNISFAKLIFINANYLGHINRHTLKAVSKNI